MHFPLTQSQRSILALVCVILFWWTGKKFVWKQQPAMAQIDDPSSSVTEELPITTTTGTDTSGSDIPAQSQSTTTVTTFYAPQSDAPPADVFSDTPATESTALFSAETTVSQSEPVVSSAAPATPGVVGLTAAPDGYFDDALFIGDSRTVGMASYGPIDGATYFATVGLSTYKLDEAVSEVPGTQGMTFAQVLSAKQYSKIYIMLGINELGYTFQTTMQNFRDLITRVQTAHPGAIVYMQANLHVAASRSQTDAVVNNTVINNFNASLAEMADDQTVFYLDVNPLFDDASGCLNVEFTRDGTHPVAKSYLTWSDWIRQHVIVQ